MRPVPMAKNFYRRELRQYQIPFFVEVEVAGKIFRAAYTVDMERITVKAGDMVMEGVRTHGSHLADAARLLNHWLADNAPR